jgi:xanthosine utilization system XapX-like protein
MELVVIAFVGIVGGYVCHQILSAIRNMLDEMQFRRWAKRRREAAQKPHQ